ncbi:MAG: glycosyltransferase [Singulisphaera sp.]
MVGHLCRLEATVLCCHGYKPDIVGWLAARRAGLPAVAVSHGWTAVTPRVRLFEALDRLVLRAMDRVVCVSEAQATKVRRAGVRAERVVVICNAIGADGPDGPDPADRDQLQALFAAPRRRIVGAVGRLSPEKGFDVLVEAAALVAADDPSVGFVLFGEGPRREPLARRVAELGLGGRFAMPGFRDDLGRFFPCFDLVALPSFTEGLPVVLLEAFAARVPVVATAVGGIPEVVEDGVSGYLVPPRDPAALARRIGEALADEPARAAMGARGQRRVREEFSLEALGRGFEALYDGVAGRWTPG